MFPTDFLSHMLEIQIIGFNGGIRKTTISMQPRMGVKDKGLLFSLLQGVGREMLADFPQMLQIACEEQPETDS